MQRLGFRILPEAGGAPGEHDRCRVRQEVDNGGRADDAKVCLRGEAADQYSAPPASR